MTITVLRPKAASPVKFRKRRGLGTVAGYAVGVTNGQTKLEFSIDGGDWSTLASKPAAKSGKVRFRKRRAGRGLELANGTFELGIRARLGAETIGRTNILYNLRD